MRRLIMIIIASLSSFLLVSASFAYPLYNVKIWGAHGDGISDDTNVFLAIWKAACKNPKGPILLIPWGYTFLVGQLYFDGPCKSNIIVQVDGNILRPKVLWSKYAAHWITFHSVNGLTIRGSGQIDGQGALFWASKRAHLIQAPPNALGISKCEDVQLSGFKVINSPKMHLNIHDCNRVNVTGLTIIAPPFSPNTDGIHIQRSQHVRVSNIIIGTGDDCISIGTGTSDVNITWIRCGDGHGISIGSLGKGRSKAQVEQIRVRNCHLLRTTNGIRIKTWQGGSGYARGISFENIHFTAVKHPIIIDQYYCDKPDHSCRSQVSAVRVSDVTYKGVYGTSRSKVAIDLKCSRTTVGCTGIKMVNVSLRPYDAGAKLETYCSNAHGVQAGFVSPPLPCLN